MSYRNQNTRYHSTEPARLVNASQYRFHEPANHAPIHHETPVHRNNAPTYSPSSSQYRYNIKPVNVAPSPYRSTPSRYYNPSYHRNPPSPYHSTPAPYRDTPAPYPINLPYHHATPFNPKDDERQETISSEELAEISRRVEAHQRKMRMMEEEEERRNEEEEKEREEAELE